MVMEHEWSKIDAKDAKAEIRADAEHRVSKLTKAEKTFVLELAENDHEIVREGKLLKVHRDLEDKGWLNIKSDDLFQGFERHTIRFSLDGWDALNFLLDQMGEA